jgi:hydroxymethylpyrimidine pyrophosphatase-like HAD family hydrolase
MKSSVEFNPEVKVFLSDVDETVADNFTPAAPEMTDELSGLLSEGKKLVFISGASVSRIKRRVVDAIDPSLRKGILISHCSGAEVWGFQNSGELQSEPYYTLYESTLDEQQRTKWREIIQQLITEFNLNVHEPMTAGEFKKKYGDNPLDVMLEDRGPQITFEFINGYDLTPEQEAELETAVPQTHGALDLRIPVLERADSLLQEANIPVTPRIAGVWAVDFALKGVSKTESVKRILSDDRCLEVLGLSKEDVTNPQTFEIWGDRFDQFRGGTDRHIQEAVSPKVRAIDFRDEDPAGFMEGYNIVLWDGQEHLHHGLLEYLKTRH